MQRPQSACIVALVTPKLSPVVEDNAEPQLAQTDVGIEASIAAVSSNLKSGKGAGVMEKRFDANAVRVQSSKNSTSTYKFQISLRTWNLSLILKNLRSSLS